MNLELTRGEIPDHLMKFFKPIGHKPKDLIDTPHMLAEALRRDGWYFRSEVCWHKPNPMPESVTDRPTKSHEYVFLFAKSLRYWYDADAIKEPAKDESIARQDRGVSDSHKHTNGAPGQPPHSLARSRPNRKTGGGFSQRYAEAQLNHGGQSERKIYESVNARTVWTIATQPNSLAHFAMMPPELARRCILAGCPKGGIVLDPFMGAGTTAIEAHKLNRYYIGSELNPANVTLTNNRLHLGDETTKAIERGEPTTLPLFEVPA